MNNEQTRTIDSIVDVEEEKQSVENSTEVTHEEVNETETEAEVETTSDDIETEQSEAPDNESEPDDSTDETENTAENENSNENDTSEETELTAETETNTSETDADESETDLTTESDSPQSTSEESDQPAEVESDTSEGEPTVTTTPEDTSEVSTSEPEATSTTEEHASDTGEEQDEAMSQESLEEAYDNSLKAFTDGEIVKGTVVDVSRDEVMIDIGFKSEGYIPAAEFESGEDDMPMVKVGDEIDVFIVRREDSEGQINLSKIKADQTLVWDEISSAFDSGTPVEGHITERIKGGLRVSVGSLRGFLPASQVEMRPIQNLDQYIGETFQMKVISMNRKRNNIVLSRRAWLETEMAEKKEEVLKTLEVDQLVTGVVKNITTFGAFVDLGGVDGLLHKTDMAWKRIHHPSEIVELGDEIEVQVIAIDIETEKISLGLKQKTSDPWENVEEKYAIGSRVSGTVVNIVNYGVFVQLEEAVEGLIHVSEMAWTRRNVAPSRIVSKGDEIEAIVLEISKEDKRISLGIKQLQPNPWEILEQKYPEGTKIIGRIRNLTNFGAFVEIEEGIDGLIHTSDLSWTDRGSNPQEVLKEGEEVEVVVLQIDASERRVSLGLKQTQPDPWDEVPEKYKVGSVVRGQIVNLTSFGAFTKLEEGIDGLIHISEIADKRIDRPEEVVSVGDELDVKVINLDPKNRRIGLSLKAAQADQERASTPPEERQERQERPRRQQRPAPDREPRQTKPVEEEETIMGALLKQEMGKNNVDNLLNSQTVEETTAENKTPEDTSHAEASEDVVSEDVVSEDVVSEDVVSEDVVSEDVVSEDVKSEDVSTEVVASEDVASEDIASEDIASEDIASEDIASEDVSTEVVASEDVASEDVKSEDVENEENSESSENIETQESAENAESSEESETEETSNDAEEIETAQENKNAESSEETDNSVS